MRPQAFHREQGERTRELFNGTAAAVFLHAPDALDACQRTHPPGVVAYYYYNATQPLRMYAI